MKSSLVKTESLSKINMFMIFSLSSCKLMTRYISAVQNPEVTCDSSNGLNFIVKSVWNKDYHNYYDNFAKNSKCRYMLLPMNSTYIF